ncbi:hypothetical protein NG895_01730 [Aeoliella sp. ICT_H6.2]|uniref:Uncharacterized protein n=1 Tax=Aeoliella straminimaris TaxID=2954799 RepID=A0A9X2FEI8_9BACT|nr:hypothetical protein [Aeoliella straminimaris]MCO6042616.1 hypothetical protein [Aeoliella straminimaris]
MKVSSAQPTRAAASILGLLLVVLCVGCRNDASQRDAYIRELRLHEDRIYELQSNMSEYQQLLRCQRMENAKLREQLDEDGESLEAARLEEEADDIEQSLLDRPTSDDDDIGLPDVQLGEPDLPEVDLGEPEVLPGPDDDLSMRAGEGETQLASATVFAPPARPSEPAESCAIYAEQMPIEPSAAAGENGIGLMAIVEPLTATGGNGYFTGEVSLMLIDPVEGEDNWQLARWDYSPEEVESAWRDVSRRVLDLPLAVPTSAPRGRPLELWVRLIPTEGDRKILCSTSISLAEEVALLGVPVSGGESSTDPAARITTGWQAADDLTSPVAKKPQGPSTTWQAATRLPPPAVVRAEATDGEGSRESNVARRAPGWSPFR